MAIFVSKIEVTCTVVGGACPLSTCRMIFYHSAVLGQVRALGITGNKRYFDFQGLLGGLYCFVDQSNI